MKYLCFLISAFALVLGACESHSWEDVKDEDGNVTEKGTKRLFETHKVDGAGHGSGHGDKAGEHGGKNTEHEGDKGFSGRDAIDIFEGDDKHEEGAGKDAKSDDSNH